MDTRKYVLIVDDEPYMCEILKDRFMDCNEETDSPYEFVVDVALSATECIRRIRGRSIASDRPPYDVIVLDVRMEEERSGLEVSFALSEQAGVDTPIRIIFTGFPGYGGCVESIRFGAWDYIVKEDVGNTSMSQIVVDSAITRLHQLDVRREHERELAADWLPRHLSELQSQYGGQLVALWHRPEVTVIANGQDAFALEAKLEDWRAQHAAWEQPFIVQIPSRRGLGEEG